VPVVLLRYAGKIFFLQPAPSDRHRSHALKIRFFLCLPFKVLPSIAIGNFCPFVLIIRDGKLKNSKPEGNKDEEKEEEEEEEKERYV
jgi:hypothetical protein